MSKNILRVIFVTYQKKIQSLIKWGQEIKYWAQSEPSEIHEAECQNPWFIKNFVLKSLEGLEKFLDPINLQAWTQQYVIPEGKIKKIGIIAAGNIPLVVFHDLLSVLITNNTALIKLSHQDNILLPALIELLKKIDEDLHSRIELTDQIGHVDALIATGSDNTSRYFKETFSHIPHLIRKNRSSCAVLSGRESPEELVLLSNDIFQYFGLGCRNVSCLFVPKNYQFETFINAMTGYSWLRKNKKYLNNYIFERSIRRINNSTFIDGGFFILEENLAITSPISCINYIIYNSKEHLEETLLHFRNKIQCIVGNDLGIEKVLPGQAQYPNLWDFPDQVDTINFLNKI